jgi:succinate dehydrogenase / fumarate reductase cytochrome b subunit
MLARAHSLLGVFPLGAFLCLHLYDNWPALRDRELWVDRSLDTLSRPWAIALVLVPLGLHAFLGALRLLLAPADMREVLKGGRSLRVIQSLTGVVVLGFVVYHVGQLWALGEGPNTSTRASYALLWRTLGRPLDLALYVVGITAVCFHFGHGLSRMAVTFRLARTETSLRWVRIAAGACGFLMLGLFLQLLGHFALGAPLLGVFAD